MSQDHDPFALAGSVLERKYRIDTVVGHGGFGVVYRGFHLAFQHQIAVKCLKIPEHFTPEAQALFVAQFREEGQHLSRLASAHMSIVRVFDFGIATTPRGAPLPYLVLEWLDGSSLDTMLAGRRARGLARFGELDAMALLRPAIEGLAAAHRLGVAHRDVKPGNLYVVSGASGGSVPSVATLKVLDFGIAKAMQEGETATVATTRASTGFSPFSAQHGAPEQFSPRKFGATGPWTDVHALGLVLVELVSGSPAFRGEDYGELFLEATADARPTPRTRGAIVSDDFEALCARCLARAPAERFASAGELLQAMDAVANGGVAPRPTPAFGPPTPGIGPIPGFTALAPNPPAPSIVVSPGGTPGPRLARLTPEGGKRRGSTGAIVAAVIGLLALGGLVTGGVLFATRKSVDTSRAECASGDVDACQRACDKDHAPSCAALGRRLFTGDGTTKDEGRAVLALKRACAGAETAGCSLLGVAYERGRGGLAKDDKRAVELYQRACDADDRAGCASLGAVIEAGRPGVARDEKRAVGLYQRACDGNVLAGCALLGVAYEKGKGGIGKDDKRAVALHQRACDGGDLRGCNSLAFAYERGFGGLARDPGRAIDLYRRACDGGELRGCNNLGYAYEHARGGLAKDEARAAAYYAQACDGDYTDACSNVGRFYQLGLGGLAKDDKRAVELYKRACDGGSGAGCTNLGFAYDHGSAGLPKDRKRALSFYERACDQTGVDGCTNLAVAYEHGDGATKDEKRAVELYRRGCDGGDWLACTDLGVQYEHGRGGLPKDVDSAVELFRRSCDAGEADGCARLGLAFEYGKGTLAKDMKRAVPFYQRACDGTSALGCAGLAHAYERGVGGVALDAKRAAELYQRACDGGVQYACDALKRSGGGRR